MMPSRHLALLLGLSWSGLLLVSHLRAVAGAPVKADVAPEPGWTLLNDSMSLVRRLEGLLAAGNGSDVGLRVRTLGTEQVKVIRAHGLLLAMQSPVLERMLLARNDSAAALVLSETPDCADLFDKFIRYLYCGDVSVRVDQAISLHKLASKYQVRSLQQGLSQYMSQHLSSDPGHVVAWYKYALATGDAALRHSCLQYLSWNLSSVLQSPEWGSVGEELLLSLLRRSDLVLQSELELYQALEAWVERNRPAGKTAEAALRLLRYGMIPPQSLFRLQTQSALMRKYSESVRDLLYLAFQFHSASPVTLAKYFEVNCSIFTPRNYLSSSWGSPWIISNPARDDRSFSFQTQLGPSGHDAARRVTWNSLFSPRWLPLSYGDMGATQRTDGRPRVIVTPATSSPDFAGVSFQKTLLVMARQQGTVLVRHVYNFHQSTEEAGDFLAGADLQRRVSEYLIDSSLYLHVVIKPLYHSLLVAKK